MTKQLPAVVLPTKAVDLFSCDKMEEMIVKIESHARSIVPDLTTDKGRKAVASNAAQVSRSKTTLDALGKDLVSGWKNKAKVVDAERKTMRDRLDVLRDEIRKPLSDWEAEQKAVAIAKLAAAELLEAHTTALEDNVYFDRERDLALREAAQAAEEAEHQAKLDAEKAERLEKMRLEREAEEEAERFERERLAQIKADKQAVIDQAAHDARVAEEAAQAVQDAADALVRDAEERANKLRLEAENAKLREAKAKADAELKEANRIEREEYEAKAAKEAQARREANTRNVGAKRKQAKEDLMDLVGLSQAQATAVVLAISKGHITNVKIEY